MQAGAENPRAGWEPNHEGFRPWAHYRGGIIIDPYNIDTGVRQYSMSILLRAGYDLSPDAQEVIGEMLRNGEFPVIRVSRRRLCGRNRRGADDLWIGAGLGF